MKTVKNVLFFGKSEELYETIECFMENIESAKLYKYPCEEQVLLKKCSESIPNVVFVDFTKKSSQETINLCKIVSYYKTKIVYKSIVFVALLTNEDDRTLTDLMISSGFLYTHIKGSDTEIFLTDLCYIAFEAEIAIPSFARGKQINLPLAINSIASLKTIDEQYMVIETDVLLDDEQNADIELGIFGTRNKYKMEIIERIEEFNNFHFEHSYRLRIPLEEPWDEPTTESISKETLNSWLDSHNEDLLASSNKVLILTQDKKITTELFDCFTEHLQIEMDLDENTITKRIENSLPELIFICLKNPNGDLPDFDRLDLILEIIKDIGGSYLPILFLANSPSTKEALAKVYNYPPLMATDQDLPSQLTKNLIQKFLTAKNISFNEKVFAFQDLSRLVSIDFEVIVTSLTEHDITFTTNKELPMFSCLKLNLPFESFITIVPSFVELPAVPERIHYQAFIHGLSEKNQDRLRSLIYQICHRPLKEFSAESISSAIKRDHYYDENFKNKANANKNETKVTEPIKKEEEVVYKRANISGRSKL